MEEGIHWFHQTRQRPVVVLPEGVEAAVVNQLMAAGYEPVVTRHPEAVRMLAPEMSVPADDLLLAALEALTQADIGTRANLVENLLAKVRKQVRSQRGGK